MHAFGGDDGVPGDDPAFTVPIPATHRLPGEPDLHMAVVAPDGQSHVTPLHEPLLRVQREDFVPPHVIALREGPPESMARSVERRRRREY